jgi:small subunit ribosomal protein S20
MANTSSAKKAVRKMERRTAVNKDRRTEMRSSIRTVEEAVAAGDKSKAAEALRKAQPLIARNGQKGVLHAKTASRKISRLAARIKALG